VNKRPFILLAVLLAIAAGAGLLLRDIQRAPAGDTRIERWTAMGTEARLFFAEGTPPISRAAFASDVHKTYIDLSLLLNAHDPTSEIAHLTSTNNWEAIVSDEVKPCYIAAFRLMKETDGLFNPLLGKKLGRAALFDLGAIAKGFAVDRAAALFAAYPELPAALVDLGGNLRACGGSFDVDVRDPAGDAETPIAVFTLDAGAACATSGLYERGAHILDGRSGVAADGKTCLAVTVVHPSSAMLADGLSTVLFLLGPERGAAFLRTHYPEADALWIIPAAEGRSIEATPGISGRIFRAGVRVTTRAM